MILLFLLTADIDIAVERETAKEEERKAIKSELNIASSPVPAPVGEEDAIAIQAFKVKEPSFVKNALYTIDNSGGARNRKIRQESTKASSLFHPFAFFMILLDLDAFFSSLPYPETRRRKDIIINENRAREEDDTVFTSVYVRL